MVGRGSFLALAALASWPPTTATSRPPSACLERAPRASTPATCRSASSWPTPCSAPTDADPARRARPPRAAGNDTADLVAVPRHRVLRARPRRASPRPCSAAPSAQRRSTRRRARRPGRGAAHPAPLRRRRGRRWRAAIGTPAVPRAAALARPGGASLAGDAAAAEAGRRGVRRGRGDPRRDRLPARLRDATPTTTRPRRRRRSPSRRPRTSVPCSTRWRASRSTSFRARSCRPSARVDRRRPRWPR